MWKPPEPNDRLGEILAGASGTAVPPEQTAAKARSKRRAKDAVRDAEKAIETSKKTKKQILAEKKRLEAEERREAKRAQKEAERAQKEALAAQKREAREAKRAQKEALAAQKREAREAKRAQKEAAEAKRAQNAITPTIQTPKSARVLGDNVVRTLKNPTQKPEFHGVTRTPPTPTRPHLIYNPYTLDDAYAAGSSRFVTPVSTPTHAANILDERLRRLDAVNLSSRVTDPYGRTLDLKSLHTGLSASQMKAMQARISELREGTYPNKRAELRAIQSAYGDLKAVEREVLRDARTRASLHTGFVGSTGEHVKLDNRSVKRLGTRAESMGMREEASILSTANPFRSNKSALKSVINRVLREGSKRAKRGLSTRALFGDVWDASQGRLTLGSFRNAEEVFDAARKAGIIPTQHPAFQQLVGKTFETADFKPAIREVFKANKEMAKMNAASQRTIRTMAGEVSAGGIVDNRVRLVSEYGKSARALHLLDEATDMETEARLRSFRRRANAASTAKDFESLGKELDSLSKKARSAIRMCEQVDRLQNAGIVDEKRAAQIRAKVRDRELAREIRARRWTTNKEAFKYAISGAPVRGIGFGQFRGFKYAFSGIKDAFANAASAFGTMWKFNRMNVVGVIGHFVGKIFSKFLTLAKAGGVITGASALGAVGATRALTNLADERTTRENLYNFALPDRYKSIGTYDQFENFAYKRARSVRMTSANWQAGVLDLANAVASSTAAGGSHLISNMEQVVLMFENLSKMQKLAGTPDANFNGVMVQLLQGIGKGKLDMQDIKPILNQSGAFAELLAKEVFGLKGRGDLYAAMDAGRGDMNAGLTAERMIRGLISPELTRKLNEKFVQTAKTWGDIVSIMKADAGEVFKPLIRSFADGSNGGLGQLLTSITGELARSNLGLELRNWVIGRLMPIINGEGGVLGAINRFLHSFGAFIEGFAHLGNICLDAFSAFTRGLLGVFKFIDTIVPEGIFQFGLQDAARFYGVPVEALQDTRNYDRITAPLMTHAAIDRGWMPMSQLPGAIGSFNPKLYDPNRQLDPAFRADDSLVDRAVSEARSTWKSRLGEGIDEALNVGRVMWDGIADAGAALAKTTLKTYNPDAPALDGALLPLEAQTAANTEEIKKNTAKATEVQVALLKQLAGRATINRITQVHPNIVANVGTIKSGADLNELMDKMKGATAKAIAAYAY